MKTLKDFSIRTSGAYYPELIREEAIKWIKEDLKWIGSTGAEKGLIIRWMERFNITKEDLK